MASNTDLMQWEDDEEEIAGFNAEGQFKKEASVKIDKDQKVVHGFHGLHIMRNLLRCPGSVRRSTAGNNKSWQAMAGHGWQWLVRVGMRYRRLGRVSLRKLFQIKHS